MISIQPAPRKMPWFGCLSVQQLPQILPKGVTVSCPQSHQVARAAENCLPPVSASAGKFILNASPRTPKFEQVPS